MTSPSAAQLPADAPTCYRHPGRQTFVRCTRCERPICGDCMRSAAVGHQCVECVEAGARTVRPERTRFGGRERFGMPVITIGLIVVNVLAFVAEMAIPDVQRQFALWPPAVADGQFYRLVTSAFLHYGPTHLLLNMWALYVVGQPLEMWLGRLRFVGLYALSGLGGSVLVYLLSPLNTATAGCLGSGIRAVRRHVRGGQAAHPRRPLGGRRNRVQPRFHVRVAAGQFTADQLAGTRGWVGRGCAGFSGVRIRASAATGSGPGGGDGCPAGPVRGADLVANGVTPGPVRVTRLRQRADANAPGAIAPRCFCVCSRGQGA